METEKIFVLVGKRVRSAQAVIKPSGIAVIQTPHGPIEFSKWHRTERAAKLSIARKNKIKPDGRKVAK